MSNPFDDLRKQKEAIIEKERRKPEAEEIAEWLARQAREEAHRQYDGLVTGVLRQLMEAVYQGNVSLEGWEIVSYWESPEVEGEICSRAEVSVRLVFDSKNRPTCFECCMSYEHNCRTRGMAREQLVAALQDLYSRALRSRRFPESRRSLAAPFTASPTSPIRGRKTGGPAASLGQPSCR